MYPFAILDEIIYKNKKQTICQLSKQTIQAGDQVYAYKYRNFNDEKFLYLIKSIADKDDLFIENKKNFINRTYSIPQLFGRISKWSAHDEALFPLVEDYEKGLHFLQHPMQFVCRYPYYYPNPNDKIIATQYQDVSELYPPHLKEDKGIDKALNQYFRELTKDQQYDSSRWNDIIRNKLYKKEEELRNTILTCHAMLSILSVWLCTPIHTRLIADWDGFSDELKIVLSLSNIVDFTHNVVHKMKIPNWDKLLQALFAEKFTLTELEYVIQWSIANASYIPLLSKVLHVYEIHFFSHKPSLDFFKYTTNDNATRFVYLFINEPEYLPVLHRFIQSDGIAYPLSSSSVFTYMKCHFYRATIFYNIQHQNTTKALALLDKMPAVINYHYNGSPKSFINETVKWAKKMMGK